MHLCTEADINMGHLCTALVPARGWVCVFAMEEASPAARSSTLVPGLGLSILHCGPHPSCALLDEAAPLHLLLQVRGADLSEGR